MMSFTKCMCFVLLMLVMQFSYSNELRLKSIRLSQGGISNQSYDVLSELEQSGSSDEQNDWETYIEITPGHKRLSAKFFFTIDEFEPGNSVDWISIEANTLGAAFDEQRRFYYIRNFQQRRWEKIFDNSNDNSWYWSRNSVDLTENAGQYVSKRGSVVIRLRSNNNLDVVDIDQLVVKVYNGGENVPPGVTPTPIATPRPSLPTLPPTVIPTPTTTQTPIPTAIPSTLPTSIPLPSIEPTPIPLPTSIPLPTAVPVEYINIPLQSSITRVQPMTGIVLWSSDHNNTPFKNRNDVIQLEYTYVRPADIVIGENKYNWAPLERLLDEVASRGKQSILRWYYVYPGERETAVPSYIKSIAGYSETLEVSEGKLTGFPDWSHSALKKAHLNFYQAFSSKYDKDPRIAFLQVGFGLWGEYHIYDPSVRLGENFPDKAFQAEFLQHMGSTFKELKWSVSIDAGDSLHSPIESQANLLSIDFGLFDDSFMHETHSGYNEEMWNALAYKKRYKLSPHGGELSYYSDFDQRHALDVNGMHGRTYEELSRKFNISYMIGNDQPSYQSVERIKQAGLANGYKFKIETFLASASKSKVTVTNIGVAPIYYDAFISVNGVRAEESLKSLLPNESREYVINAGGESPVLRIESDRLVDGQVIQFEADLM